MHKNKTTRKTQTVLDVVKFNTKEKFEVIQPKGNQTIQLCPSGIKGYLVD